MLLFFQMNSHLQIESLPNEILVEIFEYLDARDLYHAFYNLNYRFNQLLQSLNELSLILSICDRNQSISSQPIFLPYIHTLIIKYKTEIQLNNYINLRRLILCWLTYTRPYKFETVHLPYLEYLSIHFKGSPTNFALQRLHETIFSNGFPCLKYCSLPQYSTIQKTDRWTNVPSLCILKIGYIGLLTYISILSACPNLQSFHFHEERIRQLSTNIPHYPKQTQLRRLIIHDKHINPTIQTGILNEYILCVPHLEYLSVHGTTYQMKDFHYLFEFDWYASIIATNLISLRQLNIYLPVFQTKRKTKPVHDEFFLQLEKFIFQIHNNRYFVRVTPNRKNELDFEYCDSSDLSD